MSMPRMSSEMNRQETSSNSNRRPLTSTRSPRSARSTEPWTAAASAMVVVSAMPSPSVDLAHPAHEAVADDVEDQRDEEQDDADHEQAGVGERRPLDLV